MSEEEINENEESLTSEETDEDEASSPQDQGGEATPEQATGEPFHTHPRFQELIQERNELKQTTQQLQQQLIDLTGRVTPQQQQQVAEQKLYEANTPEEKQFWAQVEKIADAKATKARAEAEARYQQEIAGYQKMVSTVIADRFLEKHSDVGKGSAEMAQIVKKAQKDASLGKDLVESLEDAYRVVMFDRKAQMEVDKAVKSNQTKTKQKLAANVEKKGIPQNSGLPPGNDSLEDAFSKAWKECGL